MITVIEFMFNSYKYCRENRMIDKSNERAKREGVESKVEFRVADVQNLPFDDALFDVVM
ncbi:unnamed protein product, partial [marine sediment metagenome]